jgi:hypothetical protein
MSLSKKILVLLLSVSALLHSCRKEGGTSWDTNVYAPLFKASFSIAELLGDSLVEVNNEGYLSIIYRNSIYDFDLKELVEIPDTTLSFSYSIPFGSLYLNPGQVIFNRNEENKYNFGDASLNRCILVSGVSEIKVTSEIKEVIELTYTIPKAKKNNVPFSVNIIVPAAKENEYGVFIGSFDLTGYDIDLTGPAGNSANTVGTFMSARVSGNGQPLVVVAGDSLTVQNKFINTVPYYASGYFGSSKHSTGLEGSDINIFKKIKAGDLLLDNVYLKINIENGVGADARFRINEIYAQSNRKGQSISLTHDMVGKNHNITRAQDRLFNHPEVIPSDYDFILNTGNSNLKSMIELLPDKFYYDFDLQINPLGNISGGNDFIHNNFGFKANMDLQIPLKLGAHNLTLVDTLTLNKEAVKDPERINNGTFTLLAENDFPFDADVKIYIPVENTTGIKDSLVAELPGKVRAGVVDAQGVVKNKTKSTLRFIAGDARTQNLLNAEKLIVKIVFDTKPNNQKLEIYEHYRLDLKLTGDFSYTIQVK